MNAYVQQQNLQRLPDIYHVMSTWQLSSNTPTDLTPSSHIPIG